MVIAAPLPVQSPAKDSSRTPVPASVDEELPVAESVYGQEYRQHRSKVASRCLSGGRSILHPQICTYAPALVPISGSLAILPKEAVRSLYKPLHSENCFPKRIPTELSHKRRTRKPPPLSVRLSVLPPVADSVVCLLS